MSRRRREARRSQVPFAVRVDRALEPMRQAAEHLAAAGDRVAEAAREAGDRIRESVTPRPVVALDEPGVELLAMTVTQLRERAVELEISLAGARTKAAIIARLTQ